MNSDFIKEPTLIIDKCRAISNIKTMSLKAKKSNVEFRPHFKTHQSELVAEWYRKEGITKITVSSVMMAKYFASLGWNDITIAFPLNIREIDDIDSLAGVVELNILVSSIIHAEFLSKKSKNNLGVFIKIDTGYHRSGIEPTELSVVASVLQLLRVNKNLHFKGFISHFGNTYHTKNKNEIFSIYQSGIQSLIELKNQFVKDFPGLKISVGDTPSCSVVENFEGIDEIRPGNFVYYDLMMQKLGVCAEEQISVIAACPVIDKYINRNEILIYGGAVHLSKEYLLDIQNNRTYGSVVMLNENGWGKSIPGARVKNISQEHGIISINEADFENIQIGGLIGILPVHSCLTADLLKKTYILE